MFNLHSSVEQSNQERQGLEVKNNKVKLDTDKYSAGYLVGQGDGSCNSKEKKYDSQKYKIFDLTNTIVKMAQKRALVAAVLSSCGASQFFTQDLETIPQGYKVPRGES